MELLLTSKPATGGYAACVSYAASGRFGHKITRRPWRALASRRAPKGAPLLLVNVSGTRSLIRRAEVTREAPCSTDNTDNSGGGKSGSCSR